MPTTKRFDTGMVPEKTPTNWDEENKRESERSEKETSISARIIRTVAVSMSITEIDLLIQSLGKARIDLSQTERMIHAEFIEAVERVRF